MNQYRISYSAVSFRTEYFNNFVWLGPLVARWGGEGVIYVASDPNNALFGKVIEGEILRGSNLWGVEGVTLSTFSS